MYSNRYRSGRAGGFSLIEVLIATVVVGLAIVSLVGANTYFTQANSAGCDMSTAEFLCEQVRELTSLSAYNDLAAFNGKNYSPPINASEEPLSDFGRFRQEVTVEKVNDSNFEQVVTYPTNFLRITVRVFSGDKEITSISWIRAKL